MNIFILDKDPNIAATFACDRHVVKILLEVAQILSTNIRFHKNVANFYKKTHENHPCTIWARATRHNFMWAAVYGLALSDEYTWRYGKQHKSRLIIEKAIDYADCFVHDDLTPFAQAMPQQFKNQDPVHAYRTYYAAAKYKICTWKPPAIEPIWWKTYRNYVITHHLEI